MKHLTLHLYECLPICAHICCLQIICCSFNRLYLAYLPILAYLLQEKVYSSRIMLLLFTTYYCHYPLLLPSLSLSLSVDSIVTQNKCLFDFMTILNRSLLYIYSKISIKYILGLSFFFSLFKSVEY